MSHLLPIMNLKQLCCYQIMFYVLFVDLTRDNFLNTFLVIIDLIFDEVDLLVYHQQFSLLAVNTSLGILWLMYFAKRNMVILCLALNHKSVFHNFTFSFLLLCLNRLKFLLLPTKTNTSIQSGRPCFSGLWITVDFQLFSTCRTICRAALSSDLRIFDTWCCNQLIAIRF